MVRQRSLSLNGALKFGLLAGAIFFVGWSVDPSSAQESAQDKKAWQIREVAFNAQKAEDFRTAGRKWQELLDTYPNSPVSRPAWQNLGLCFYNEEDYGSAILAFKKSLPILREDESPAIPEVLLSLGYSRIREGRRLAVSDPDESKSQFTTAANDLNTVLVNYKDSPLAATAAFHRGNAFQALGQIEDATASYKQALDFKPDDVRVDCMFALGGINHDKGDFEEASRWYDRIRTVIDKDKGHKLFTDTTFNYGSSLYNIGIGHLGRKDVEAANKKFTETKAILAEVTQDQTFDQRDDALFMDASSSKYLGNDAEAAELFESVSKIEGSKRANEALVSAGLSWLKAGNEDRGTKVLKTVIDSSDSWSVDAVHRLALYLIDKDRGQEAFELTDQWVPKLGKHPLAVNVLLDRANASRIVPGLADRSADLYAQIAKEYPSHQLAPNCLYQSLVSNFDDGKHDIAITQTENFQKDYPGDDLLSGALEIQGNSLLMKDQYREAEAVFRNLVTEFQSEKQYLSSWITRVGYASYLQKNYDETIAWLEKNDASITSPAHKAESLHWIGSSHYEKEEFREAADKLQQSLDIDRKWNRTSEVMLALCNAQLKLSQFDDAEKTAITMLETFPDDPNLNVSRALYAVGDESLLVKEYDRSIRNFDLISSKLKGSELTPVAVYRSAFAAVQNGNGEEAAKRFTSFLKDFPDHELAQQAQLGQTNALRMTGNTAESIVGLKQLVEDATDDDTRFKAKYQLGLAYVDETDWANAVATFSSMTEGLTSENVDADKIWYELAWAQRENGDADESLKSFTKLAENFPNSSSAPEANFLLGSSAYTEKEYDKAIEFYALADSETARDEIREKARYKLGWCHYKKGNYSAAGEKFQKQADDFPKGNLYADGRYMVAQCAWRANNYKKAFQAYTVANP